jgi:hypothetical protein
MANTDKIPTQPQGNFVIYLNFKRAANPKAPPITGRISTPEDPETEFNFSAFEHTDKNGESYWIGPVKMNCSMRQALNTETQQGTNFVAIREKGFKVSKDDQKGQPNAAYAKLTVAEQAHEDSKPAYWASWSRTDAEPQFRASAWERGASRYGPWASGNTQHPLTKEQAAALKAGMPDAAMLNAPEPAAATPRRSRAEGRDRA